MKNINSKTIWVIVILVGSLIIFQNPSITGNAIKDQKYTQKIKDIGNDGEGNPICEKGDVKCCQDYLKSNLDSTCDALCKDLDHSGGRAVCNSHGQGSGGMCFLRCHCACIKITVSGTDATSK
ncbi:hypothetical protein HN363_00280 [Candidatus Woesearchaeota archaeon]|nr:hypothetical protein [Candidatus Woesearchaeota archaeon]